MESSNAPTLRRRNIVRLACIGVLGVGIGILGHEGAKVQKDIDQVKAQYTQLETLVDADQDGIYSPQEIATFLRGVGYDRPIYPGTQFEILDVKGAPYLQGSRIAEHSNSSYVVVPMDLAEEYFANK